MSKSPLSAEDNKIVASNWELLKRDPTKSGAALFLTFFRMYPKYQEQFSFRNVPLDQLADDKRLKRHAAGVFAALTSIIDSLENLEVLVALLEGIGDRHGRRHIEPAAFDDLTETVIVVLRENLGAVFNENAEKAWRKTLTVANTIIKQNLEINE